MQKCQQGITGVFASSTESIASNSPTPCASWVISTQGAPAPMYTPPSPPLHGHTQTHPTQHNPPLCLGQPAAWAELQWAVVRIVVLFIDNERKQLNRVSSLQQNISLRYSTHFLCQFVVDNQLVYLSLTLTSKWSSFPNEPGYSNICCLHFQLPTVTLSHCSSVNMNAIHDTALTSTHILEPAPVNFIPDTPSISCQLSAGEIQKGIQQFAPKFNVE